MWSPFERIERGNKGAILKMISNAYRGPILEFWRTFTFKISALIIKSTLIFQKVDAWQGTWFQSLLIKNHIFFLDYEGLLRETGGGQNTAEQSRLLWSPREAGTTLYIVEKCLMEAVFLSGPATKRWGVKSGLLRKKKTFFKLAKKFRHKCDH